MMSDSSTERVMVIPSSLLDNLGRFQGFCRDTAKYLPEIYACRNLSFRPREEMETDPSFKQIIPYCVLQTGDRVFCYTRGKTSGESRLVAKRSIGIGGHISDHDMPLGGGAPTELIVWTAIHRELDEEVVIAASPFSLECVGLLNDDSSPVGRVHLGLVHLLVFKNDNVHPREAAIAEAGFVELSELRAARDRLETWSQLCLDNIFKEITCVETGSNTSK